MPTQPYLKENASPVEGVKRYARRAIRTLSGMALCFATAVFSFWMHFNLSTAGSLQLLLIVFIALRWSFQQATLASLVSVFCLNYLFTTPIFRFSVAEPANLIALIAFESSALLVSALSSKVRLHAATASLERSRIARLYEVSKAILLIDRHQSTQEQLASFIRELLPVEHASFWVIYPSAQDSSIAPTQERSDSGDPGFAEEVYRANKDFDDPARRLSARLLRIGTTPIGAMVLRGWEADPMMADAVASLAALAFERERSGEKENQAEAGRRTEQLRTAVLDGLAHAIKTPITAIITANAGVLALGGLNSTQEELNALIDKESLTLNSLTTRLLRTAALESRDIKMSRSQLDIVKVLEDIMENEGIAFSERVCISAQKKQSVVVGDVQMLRIALSQLIDNAAKYSAVGTQIQITVEQQESEMRVVVGNHGSTVRKEEREKIFERFFRGSDTAFGPAGTGLGLSIVKKTAEAHGGRAWVECIGDTTTFIMTIGNPVRVHRG